MELLQNVNKRAVQDAFDISSPESCCASHSRSWKGGKGMKVEVIDNLLDDEGKWNDECND